MPDDRVGGRRLRAEPNRAYLNHTGGDGLEESLSRADAPRRIPDSSGYLAVELEVTLDWAEARRAAGSSTDRPETATSATTARSAAMRVTGTVKGQGQALVGCLVRQKRSCEGLSAVLPERQDRAEGDTG